MDITDKKIYLLPPNLVQKDNRCQSCDIKLHYGEGFYDNIEDLKCFNCGGSKNYRFWPFDKYEGCYRNKLIEEDKKVLRIECKKCNSCGIQGP